MERKRRRYPTITNILVAATASLITTMLIIMVIPMYVEKLLPIDEENNYVAQKISFDEKEKPTTNILDAESDEITDVIKDVMPSVVGISAVENQSNNFFTANEGEQWSLGSGVVVSKNGYILTNNHVIGNNPEEIVVTLEDRHTVKGKGKWSDPILDLALIKIDLNDLYPVSLGESSEVMVGEQALAIGNPLGMQFQRTVTSGIISAVNRTISIQTEQGENYMEGLIQTDASINPGNSGGPLLDSDGKVIGINTIKVSTAEGMGFAIPIDLCKPIIKGFIEKGKYETPYMGVFAHDGDVAEYISQKFSDYGGIHVTKIDENGPAYKAGLRKDDIITHVNGKKVKSMADLRENICCSCPGEECKISIIRNKKKLSIKVKMGHKKDYYSVTR